MAMNAEVHVMRTQDEILARLQEVLRRDLFGFERDSYLGMLDFDHVKNFLKPTVTSEEWNAELETNTYEALVNEIHEYMPFAWDKANDMKGVSAIRSKDRMQAWLWLLNDDTYLNHWELIPYEHYGKEKLIDICEHFGWDWKHWDNGVRSNGETSR